MFSDAARFCFCLSFQSGCYMYSVEACLPQAPELDLKKKNFVKTKDVHRPF